MSVIVGATTLTLNDATTVSSGKQACKAWVRFDSTTTLSVVSSYNVSGVVRNATGNYTVTFTNAMSSTAFCVVCSGNASQGTNGGQPLRLGTINSASSIVVLNSVPNVTSNNGRNNAVMVFAS